MTAYPLTPRNRVRRLPERGSYDHETIYAVIDAAPLGHTAFIADGLPASIPSLHARVENRILLHGSPGSRLMRHLRNGGEVSISFALVDGLVAAKSVFHHSVNYRSAVVFGRGVWLEDPDAKMEALRAFTEKVLPGRWDEVRIPSAEELRVTAVAAVEIESASAKMRAGLPGEDPIDAAAPLWNGVIPLRSQAGTVESESSLALPDSIREYMRRINGD
jgi:nitroimidazol reductase NimA-like FMN-containing flavoprotein (pyridoxamine 5'-phosphate oxidase superfamily)